MKRIAIALSLALVGIAVRGTSAPQTPTFATDPAGVEFFEKSVRPLIAESCYGCHSKDNAQANLHLDSVAGMKKGGPRGVVIVPGNPDKSLLIQAVRYKDHELLMPPTGKIATDKIALLEEWVKRGAPMPKERNVPPPAPATKGFDLAGRRKHWAYQPVKKPTVPTLLPSVGGGRKERSDASGGGQVDDFIRARLAKSGLTLSPEADKRTLIRRVTFDLTGLPPTPAEVDAFLADTKPGAYERVVDRLLASPHYGERWARHWLDLMRYGDSLGHEFDFDLLNAYQYRDYLIRAFNADVPYDQFVKEHLAGDLLPQPRRDVKTGWNESVIATGFFWLGEEKHAPVDVKQEQADRHDNQIDVLGKAFLAQTIACARCHDHKFDPIPATDYYGLYGMLQSARYQQAVVNDAAIESATKQCDIARVSFSRPRVASAWRKSITEATDTTLLQAAERAKLPAWGEIAPISQWKATGSAFTQIARPGDIVLTDTPQLIATPTPHSGLRSRRVEGAIRSPNFTITGDFLHFRVGGKRGRASVMIENYALIRGPMYDRFSRAADSVTPQWWTVDVKLWKGRRAYVELKDSPLVYLAEGTVESGNAPADGWVSFDGFGQSDDGKPPALTANALTALTPEARRARLLTALTDWEAGKVADTDALAVLNELLLNGTLDKTPLSGAQTRLNACDAFVPKAVRALALCDAPGEDTAVFVRGNYRALGEPAPRLKLACTFTETAKNLPITAGSGRLEFAKRLVSPAHPLTARVMVNRLWKHHFGVGIVASADDFGHMGEKPSHPELLDWLAATFVEEGWSIKKMHRRMVLSATYRQQSQMRDAKIEAKDPKNILLHRMNVRRLEAEAIRDAVLATSGRLDRTLYGQGVLPYLNEFAEGRGRPAPGPLDGNGRRSIYLAVRRNYLSSFLLAFDFPIPFTSIGRRTVSNVPAQALAMMNGPFVKAEAERWADATLKLPSDQRIETLYVTAFSRPPMATEKADAEAFLSASTDEKQALRDLCHVLFNVKEFLFVK